MELTADALTRVLTVCCGDEPEGPEEAVLMLHREQPSFAPTLYAAWRNEGSSLNPALRYELDVQDARMRRYRALAAELGAKVPGPIPLKGLEVADLYPAGSTRHMNDLDYAATDQVQLWQLAGELVASGWDLHTATFTTFAGRLHALVCLRQPHEDPYCLPYGVEIASYIALGDLAGVAPVLELPPAWRQPVVKNLLMLLFERFEQPYRARDLVDAALMLEALDSHQTLVSEIDRIGLWPEYTELTGLLARAGLAGGDSSAVIAATAPQPSAGTRVVPLAGMAVRTAAALGPARSIARCRLRRARRNLVGLRRPGPAVLRHLQRKLVFGQHSPPERLLWSLAERRLSAGRALRAGLLCFGLPVPGVRPDVSAATVRQLDGLTYVDTPVGRFLLTAGDEVDEASMELLADGARPAVRHEEDAAGRAAAPVP